MTDVSPTSSLTRFAYLDGLRASSALFVLVHHAMMMAFPISLGIQATGWKGYLFGPILYGHFGVTIFIVLAGYSLALGIVKRNGELPGGFLGYMKRRARRIIPPYWIAIALTMLLGFLYIGGDTGTHWDLSAPANWKAGVVDVLLLQDIVPVTNVAYTFWSVAVEWHVYLLLPIILLIRRRSTWPVAVAVGAGIGAVGVALTFVDERVGRLFPSYYILFALAVGACVALQQAPHWCNLVPWKSLAAAFIAVVAVSCATHSYQWASDNFYWLDIVLGSAVICIIISMAQGAAPCVSAVFAWKPLAATAAFSYSLYLVHAPLLQVFWQFTVVPFDLTRGQALVVMWLVACPLIVAASYGFYRIAEKPFLSKASKASVVGEGIPALGSLRPQNRVAPD